MRIEYESNCCFWEASCDICEADVQLASWQPRAYEDDGELIGDVCEDCVNAAEADGVPGLVARVRGAARWHRAQAIRMDKQAAEIADQSVLIFDDTAERDRVLAER